VKVAALQLSTLPMSASKLDYYFRICKQKEIGLVLLSEYALNSFFKELETMPLSMIKEQTNHKVKVLKELSSVYGLIVVAPIVQVKGELLIKSVAKFTPKGVSYYPQEFLINFRHWNEEKFFANEPKSYSLPVFLVEGIKFGIVNGYEAHFDAVWIDVMRKNVDVVLMPSSATFDSIMRWQEMLKTRAFLNSVYILRANRIGSFLDKEISWKFYGHSKLVNPFGEIELSLGDKEEILIAEIDKKEVVEARKVWGWKRALHKRGMI